MQQIFQTLKSAQQAYRNNDQKEAIVLLHKVVQQLPREHLSLSALQMAFGVVAILSLLLKQADEVQPPWLPKIIQQLQFAVQNQRSLPVEQLEPLRVYLSDLTQLVTQTPEMDTLDAPSGEYPNESDIVSETAPTAWEDQHAEISDVPVEEEPSDTSMQSTSADETSVQDDGTLMFLTSQIEALGAGPATVGMLLMRAEIYSRQSNWEAAVADYEAALAMSPDNASLYVKLAGVHELAGTHGRAITAAEHALSLDPNDADRSAAELVLERLQTHV